MILTLTGASGAGKTTIARELLKNLPVNTQIVPSYTTRESRDTDIPGEYKYVNKFRFRFLTKTGSFLWTVNVHGNSYGTTKRWLTRALQDYNTVYIMILVPDIIKILRGFAEEKGLLSEVYSFYIPSPSQEILRQRLENRGDSQEEVKKRLADCLKWDQDALSSGIPYEFVRNDGEVQEAIDAIKKIFLEKLSRCDCYF